MTFRECDDPDCCPDRTDWGPPPPDTSLLALKQMYATEVRELRVKVEVLEEKLRHEIRRSNLDRSILRQIEEILVR